MNYKTTAEVYREKHGHDMPIPADFTKPKRGDSAIAKREKARMRANLRGDGSENSSRRRGLEALRRCSVPILCRNPGK